MAGPRVAEKMVTRETIGRMTQRIVEQFRPTRIILFGSHARGDATADSDLDFLVVMPFSDSRLKPCVEIRKVLRGFGVPKDVILLTPDEFETYRDVPGSIAYPATHEGQVLHVA